MTTAGKLSFVGVWLTSLLVVSVGFAQPPGHGRPWGGPPGGPPHGPPFGDGGPPVERMMYFLRQLDEDRDGRLEEDELDDRRGYFARRLLERAGVKQEFPIHLSRVEEALREAFAARAEGSPQQPSSAQGQREAASQPHTQPPEGTSAGEKPPVPGFGPDSEKPAVPGFGTPGSSGAFPAGPPRRFVTGAASTQRGSSEGSSGQRELEERYRRYAEGLLRQYDRNRNGRLERDEWRHMRGDPERADRNRDGVITREELTARLMEYARRRYSSERERDSEHSSSRDSSRDDEDRPRLRFLTATERLPEGLPDWFYEKDVDLDGQIFMAEFTTDWTEAKVEEFFHYDLNRDGIITAEECLAALEAEED